ncbi:hypothetical protein B296_00051555, partial [Ensete ventricosum]
LRNRARSSATSSSPNRFSGIQFPVLGSLIQKTFSLVDAPCSPPTAAALATSSSTAGAREASAATTAYDRRLSNTKKKKKKEERRMITGSIRFDHWRSGSAN